MQVLSDLECSVCRLRFLRDLPQGFAMDHPVTIAADGKVMDGDTVPFWIMEPFLKGFRNRNDAPINIERRVFKVHRRVIVLNTLDFLYGHVLLKLYNAQHYMDNYPDHGLVVVLPRMYEWLIPKGCAEAWIIDLRLGGMQGWHNAFNNFVQQRMGDYDEVQLGKGYSHPDFTEVDIERYTGIKPFDLANFTMAPKHVTFVARQDRLWYRWPACKLAHRALRKVGLGKLLNGLFVADQECLVRRSMARIRGSQPGITFSIVGLGEPRDHAQDVNDLRTTRMDTVIERSWCEADARSQVVVGVHGSNMLLPTALAAGCVEILPHDRQGNVVQDISVRYNDRMQLFLYRFVTEFARPVEIDRQVSAMFDHFSVFERNNRINIF